MNFLRKRHQNENKIDITLVFKKFLTTLNIVFAIGFGVTILIIFGFLPRQMIFAVLALYLLYVVFSETKNGVNLFLRSIPFFIALPIMESFDNFDMGRLILLIIFIKWIIADSGWLKEMRVSWGWKDILSFFRSRKIEFLGLSLFLFAFFSLFVAFDPIPGMKKMIFVANAMFLFIVLRGLIVKDRQVAREFIKNFAYSGLLAVLFGYLQFFAAYFTQAYIFHYWWGQLVSLNMYGREWADIVTNFGNTWFSYSGSTLRLRMFSTFPDSHSFPIYIIMTLPAMFTLFFGIFKEGVFKFRNIKYGKRIIVVCLVVFALVNLALILSGTRGVWLASFSTLFLIFLFGILKINRKFSKLVFISFMIFILMFPVYLGIASFPQFTETNFSSGASIGRIRSIVDFGEASNRGRIFIWQKTLKSIKENPVLGVGIGNFPTVLNESLSASRAGSSAHNFYLQIASTMGILALLVFLWMMWEILKISIKYIKEFDENIWTVYFVMLIFAVFWVGTYLMTDAALYDGRALLGFMALLGIGVGMYRGRENNSEYQNSNVK